jgi:hypothetical protein
VLAVEGVDHLDVQLCMFQRWIVEVLDVIKEVAGQRGVGVDDGA